MIKTVSVFAQVISMINRKKFAISVAQLEAEKGFNRLSGYRELPTLVQNLSNDTYYRSLEEFRHRRPEELADFASAALRAAPSASQMRNQPLTKSKI